MNIYGFALVLVVLAALFGSQAWHEKRIDRLIRVVLARSLKEAEYFQEQYKLDLSERERELAEEREFRRKAEALARKDPSQDGDEKEYTDPKTGEKVKLSDLEDAGAWKGLGEKAIR